MNRNPRFDLFDALAYSPNLSDPYPLYAWLRENRPVHIDVDGTVYLSRYDYATLLKDPDLREAPEQEMHSYTLRTINQALIKAVPPRHTELRKAGTVAFDRDLLERGRAKAREIAEFLAKNLRANLDRNDRVDLHVDYSLPFTQRVAATVFGIPDEDFDALAALPSRMFQALYPRTTPAAVADADDASRTLFVYMEEAVRHRRFIAGSGFARLGEMSDLLPIEEIIRLCWMLWWGSYTSALAAIDLAMLTLIEHPRTSPLLHQRTAAWVEEALRYRSPHIINSANLTTRQEKTIGDVTLPPHTPVRFLLAAINRDEFAFSQAHVFDPERRNLKRHVAFGEGIHACIGAQLARMEMSTALTMLTEHLPRLTLVDQPTWRTYTTQRLCTAFPVVAAEGNAAWEKAV